MKKFFREFKEFISKGSILDMAVGVIIGNAFKAIVTSLTNDILMPVIGNFVGADVKDWKWIFKKAVVEDGVEVVAEGAIRYGQFIQTVIDFLIVAFVLFIIVKVAIKAAEKRLAFHAKHAAKHAEENGEEVVEEEVVEEEPELSPDLALLTEIRDLLKAEKVAPTKAPTPTKSKEE